MYEVNRRARRRNPQGCASPLTLTQVFILPDARFRLDCAAVRGEPVVCRGHHRVDGLSAGAAARGGGAKRTAGRVTADGDKTGMSLRLFGMTFGTAEIVIFAFLVVIITMYFMQKAR